MLSVTFCPFFSQSITLQRQFPLWTGTLNLLAIHQGKNGYVKLFITSLNLLGQSQLVLFWIFFPNVLSSSLYHNLHSRERNFDQSFKHVCLTIVRKETVNFFAFVDLNPAFPCCLDVYWTAALSIDGGLMDVLYMILYKSLIIWAHTCYFFCTWFNIILYNFLPWLYQNFAFNLMMWITGRVMVAVVKDSDLQRNT